MEIELFPVTSFVFRTNLFSSFNIVKVAKYVHRCNNNRSLHCSAALVNNSSSQVKPTWAVKYSSSKSSNEMSLHANVYYDESYLHSIYLVGIPNQVQLGTTATAMQYSTIFSTKLIFLYLLCARLYDDASIEISDYIRTYNCLRFGIIIWRRSAESYNCIIGNSQFPQFVSSTTTPHITTLSHLHIIILSHYHFIRITKQFKYSLPFFIFKSPIFLHNRPCV